MMMAYKTNTTLDIMKDRVHVHAHDELALNRALTGPSGIYMKTQVWKRKMLVLCYQKYNKSLEYIIIIARVYNDHLLRPKSCLIAQTCHVICNYLCCTSLDNDRMLVCWQVHITPIYWPFLIFLQV